MGSRRPMVAVAVVATALAGAASARAQVEPRIAYGAGNEIKQLRLDGTGVETLTRTSRGLTSYGPAWSPDGGALAFVVGPDRSDDARRSRLVVLELPSRAATSVVSGRFLLDPSFSPDGRQLVYSKQVRVGREEFTNELRLVARDGSGARRLLPTSGSNFDYAPNWSPDGRTIVFSRARSTRDGREAHEIWAVAPDGQGARRLAADAHSPSWSPDGRRIAFASTRDRNGETCFEDCSPNAEIYVMDADGGSQRRLTRTKTSESSPDWSRDGSQIAFSDSRPDPEGNGELYVMRSDGSCPTQLTNSSLPSGSPAWRPGATELVPLACGGAVRGARTPLFATDLGPLRRHRGFPLAWLGPLYRGLMPTAFDLREFVTLIYDDCGVVGGHCPVGELQVQTTSICSRHPLAYGGYGGPGESDLSPHVIRYRRVGPALLAEHPSGPELYTGSITVTLFHPSFAQAAAIARWLRIFPGSRSTLSRPRFSSRTLARVRAVRRELRRHGMRELSQRWRMSPEQIRAALALRHELRDSELRRGSRCR